MCILNQSLMKPFFAFSFKVSICAEVEQQTLDQLWRGQKEQDLQHQRRPGRVGQHWILKDSASQQKQGQGGQGHLQKLSGIDLLARKQSQ